MFRLTGWFRIHVCLVILDSTLDEYLDGLEAGRSGRLTRVTGHGKGPTDIPCFQSIVGNIRDFQNPPKPRYIGTCTCTCT